MTTDFLGVGWYFPVGPAEVSADADPAAGGKVAIAEYEQSVSQSIWLILKTSPGERVMRPDFGCGLQDHVFALATAQTANAIATEVRQALTIWEPRIDVLDVVVTPDETEQTLLIEIAYRVRAINTVFNLVYPFYLGGAAS
jgi:phage baseplate assembly protein W